MPVICLSSCSAPMRMTTKGVSIFRGMGTFTALRLDYLSLSASPVAISIADRSVINLSGLDACTCTRKGVF